MGSWTSSMANKATQQHFSNTLVKWHINTGVRDKAKIHASTLLQKDDSWCPREPVLSIFYTKRLEEKYAFQLPALKFGWEIHKIMQEASQAIVSGEAKDIYDYLVQKAFPLHEDDNTLDDETRLRYWRELFNEAGSLAIEVETTHRESEYGLLGFTPDAIIQPKIFGKVVTAILEIKGYAEEVYLRALKDPMGCAEFRAAVTQANFYMHLTKIPYATILFENKGNQRKFFTVNIEYDAEMAKPYWERYLEVVRWVEAYQQRRVESNLPAKHSGCTTPSDGRANSCPMRDACFAAPKERTKFRRPS